MIRQHFTIDEYGWDVYVYYAVDRYYTEEIMEALYTIGCRGENLHTAFRNLSAGKLDTGLTYSNYDIRKTVMVIGMTSTPAEFQNSYDHERKHLEAHIAKTFDFDPWGEEIAYLSGDIGQEMFPIAKHFLCEHCREHLMDKL